MIGRKSPLDRMTHRVVFSPEAEAQLISMQRYIGRKASPAVARSFTNAIVDYCEPLGTFPHRGTRRDEIRPGLRTIGFRRRITIAFVADDKIRLLKTVSCRGANFTDVIGSRQR